MRLLKLCACGVLAVAFAACSRDTSGTIQAPDPVAGLRYINAVPDTGGLDFRVVDIVANAPNTVNATFRTGGAPYGIPTTYLPPYFAVLAGQREIRVFKNNSNPDTASVVLFDTTFTFTQGLNYTMYLYGYSRTASTPKLAAQITCDTLPSATPLTGKKIAMRVLNLIPTTAGAPSPTTNVDVWFVAQAATTPFAGTATFTNVGFGGVTPYYLGQDSSSTLKIAATATGTNTPALISTNLQGGTLGTSTADPIPGGGVPGSGFTAILVPQSVAGSQAPAGFTTPVALFATDIKPPRTAP